MKPIYLFLTVQLNPTCLFLLFVFLLWGVRLFQPAAAIVSFLLFFNFNICSEDVFSFDLILASEQKIQKKKEKWPSKSKYRLNSKKKAINTQPCFLLYLKMANKANIALKSELNGRRVNKDNNERRSCWAKLYMIMNILFC